MRKICIITGSRSEYGLLFWIIKSLNEDQEFDVRICVTGMHLSPEFGLTYKQILEDGFSIDEKIEMLLSSDTKSSIAKGVGLGVISFADYFKRSTPDLLIILGDRFEIFAAASAAMLMNIPIAHCHGGELTEGAVDDAIRHSITKMSHLHFVSTEIYKNRVIQLGEQPERIFNVGAFGLENIKKLKLYSKKQLEEQLSVRLDKRIFLITFHPETLSTDSIEDQFQTLLNALNLFDDYLLIFTKPNADAEGRVIMKMIDNYVSLNPFKAVAYTSLGQLKYLSLLQFVTLVVGNSSSGIIEVPSFNVPTINIGSRQKGRVRGKTVINCDCTEKGIVEAIKFGLSQDFKIASDIQINPYGDGDVSIKVLKVIRELNYEGLIKKRFNDLSIV